MCELLKFEKPGEKKKHGQRWFFWGWVNCRKKNRTGGGKGVGGNLVSVATIGKNSNLKKRSETRNHCG